MAFFLRLPGLFLFLLVVGITTTPAQSAALTPEAGKPIESDLSGGQSHRYLVKLEANQFLNAVIDQLGIDVVVTLQSPEGNKLLEIDSPNGIRGEEPIWFVSAAAGVYTVLVSSLENDAKPGKYRITVKTVRNATADDRHFAAAQTSASEGINAANTRDRSGVERATEKFREAEQHFSLISTDIPAKAIGFSHLGKAYALIGMNEKALEFFDRSAELFGSVGLKRESMLAVVASLGSAQSRIDLRARNERALEIARSTGDKRSQVSAMIEISTCDYYLGDLASAIRLIRSALELAQEIGSAPAVAKIYDNMGNLYTAQGNFAAALEAHQKALEMQSAQGNTAGMPGTHLNIGNVYEGLGNTQLAIESYNKALFSFEKLRIPDGIAFATSNIGSIYLETGEYDKALEYFLKAQLMKAKFLPDDPTSFYNIGSVYHFKNRHNEAIEYLGKAIESARKTKDPGNQTLAHIELSRVYFDQKNYTRALNAANEAAAIAESFNLQRPRWAALFAASRAQTALGRNTEAARSLEVAVSLIDELRTIITNDDVSRLKFFEDKNGPFLSLISSRIKEGRDLEALSLAEKLKARTLVETIQGNKLAISKAMTNKEVEKETALKAELASLNSRASKESDEAKSRIIDSQLRSKRLEFDDFNVRLYAAHPELKVRRGDMPAFRLADAGELLADAKTILLEFVVADGESFLFAISSSRNGEPTLKTIRLDLGQKELAARIETYRSMLERGDADFQQKARELYNILLRPAASQFAGITNLIIVPDGPLWDLPFVALIDENGKYVAENASVSFAPSLTALREMVKTAKTRKAFSTSELLAFGNPTVSKETSERAKRAFMGEKLEPLPEAERLVNELGRMYGPKRSKVFKGAEAREGTAKTEAGKYRIVQFATHGILNNLSPMYSHLVFAQNENNPNEDGLLEAWELKDLDLNADLVILSACDTARGRISNGEGVIGMTWASFIAGAPSTVASQWKVESSSTTELMLEFHRRLLSKKQISKSEALRQASLRVMRMPKYKHPSYWAGFVLVGDGS